MKRLAYLLVAALSVPVAFAQQKPRLVIVISIDQFRGDYLHRFEADYLPAKKGSTVGGFRFLSQTGADYSDAHHGHIPTSTGPGHAALLTGSTPAYHGIIGNEWKDRQTGKTIYCVDDPSVETVGGTSKPMGPRNLLTTTLGDELKLATAGKAKVVGVALKDRGSILMSGHAADTVLWFENGVAGWVSSTHYCPDKKLPQWVQNLNGKGLPKQYVGQQWTPLLPADRYGLSKKAPFVPADSPSPFARPIRNMGDFWTSPFGNEFTLETARQAIVEEKLGQDEITDLVNVSLSSNDYVGHAYGPNSPEVFDMSIRTDRLLSSFFNAVEKLVPGGLNSTLIVLTADHGIMPIPEEGKGMHMPFERLSFTPTLQSLREGLNKAFGEGEWVYGIAEQYLYLNPATIAAKNVNREEIENKAAEILRQASGLHTVLTRSQVARGAVPATKLGELVTQSFHPILAGDVILIEKPGTLFSGGTGTSHGSPWEYDSHVPIVFRGPGVTAGRYSRRVHTQDIASTLSTLLGIEYPTGNVGQPLVELLKK